MYAAIAEVRHRLEVNTETRSGRTSRGCAGASASGDAFFLSARFPVQYLTARCRFGKGTSDSSDDEALFATVGVAVPERVRAVR